MRLLKSLALAWGLVAGGGASAQQTAPQEIPFEGGKFTITETEELDKILAFEGKQIARNYVVFHDRTVEVDGIPVALFSVGDGGNACGTATVIAWKPQGGGIESDIVGEDCGSPPAAVTPYGIYFVPYLMPGASEPVEVWTPKEGLRVAGTLSYTPQPGTGWPDLVPGKFENMLDALQNEAVYGAAKSLLGGKLAEVTTGLVVSGGVETTASGAFYGSGCVPHACGSADAFMAVDAKANKLYFAQEGDAPEPATWPALEAWPGEIRDAMRTSLNPPQ